MLPLWVALASGQTAVLEHRIPTTTELGLSGTGLVGADLWSAPETGPGGGPAGELRLSGGYDHGFRRTEVGIGYGGLLEVWTLPNAVDGHLLETSVRNSRGPALIGQARGSVFQEWTELGGSLAWVRPGWRVMGGSILRAGADGWSTGAAGEIDGSWTPVPRVTLSGSVRGSWYAIPEIPEALTGRGYVELAPTLRIEVGAGLSTVITGPGAPAALLGLPPPQSTVLRPELWTRYQASDTVALQLEGALELGRGTVDYLRGRAFAGVQVGFGRVRTPEVEPVHEGEILFRFEAAEAEQVAVAGSFTGWEPWPMDPAGAAWERLVAVPAGNHEYVYLVDGEPVVPPEASSWRDDGFGGRSGVLVVEARPL